MLHGPSDEKHALDQRQSLQTKLLAHEYSWPWDDTETADLISALYQDVAYQDYRAQILRDAGIIAAFFTMILVLVANFTSRSYSKSERLCFFLLALPLMVTPGLVGQVVFQKTVPIEILLFQASDVAKGFSYIGYCSIQSILIGLGDGASTFLTLIHELKVVSSAGLLVFLIVGLAR